MFMKRFLVAAICIILLAVSFSVVPTSQAVVKNNFLLESAKITDKGMQAAKDTLLRAFIENITEADVATAAEDAMTDSGSSPYVEAFAVIVASGEQSAIPHGDESDDDTNLIEWGEVVVIDLGARYRGYCTDLTRTFFMGTATENMTHVYNVTLKAQLAAIDSVQAYERAADVDAVARDIITSYGYGDKFIHGLGHGLGIYIHMPPTLSPSSNEVLFESGDMTLTIEPGIYFDGEWGMRIEDDVMVFRGSHEVITFFPKDLESVILKAPNGSDISPDESEIPSSWSDSGALLPLLGCGLLLVTGIAAYVIFRRRNKHEPE